MTRAGGRGCERRHGQEQGEEELDWVDGCMWREAQLEDELTELPELAITGQDNFLENIKTAKDPRWPHCLPFLTEGELQGLCADKEFESDFPVRWLECVTLLTRRLNAGQPDKQGGGIEAALVRSDPNRLMSWMGRLDPEIENILKQSKNAKPKQLQALSMKFQTKAQAIATHLKIDVFMLFNTGKAQQCKAVLDSVSTDSLVGMDDAARLILLKNAPVTQLREKYNSFDFDANSSRRILRALMWRALSPELGMSAPQRVAQFILALLFTCMPCFYSKQKAAARCDSIWQQQQPAAVIEMTARAAPEAT